MGIVSVVAIRVCSTSNVVTISPFLLSWLTTIVSSKSIVDDFAAQMDRTYKMKHPGVPQLMIGIKIDISSTATRLSQEKYIDQAAAKFGQDKSTPTHSPAHSSGCLSSASVGDSQPLNRDTHPYISLVGTLLWATITRPDVQVAVSRA